MFYWRWSVCLTTSWTLVNRAATVHSADRGRCGLYGLSGPGPVVDDLIAGGLDEHVQLYGWQQWYAGFVCACGIGQCIIQFRFARTTDSVRRIFISHVIHPDSCIAGFLAGNLRKHAVWIAGDAGSVVLGLLVIWILLTDRSGTALQAVDEANFHGCSFRFPVHCL